MGLSNPGFDWTVGIQQQSSQSKPPPPQQTAGPLQITREDIYGGQRKQKIADWKAQGYSDKDIYDAMYATSAALPMNQGIGNLQDYVAQMVLDLPGAMTYWTSDETNRARRLYGGKEIGWNSNDPGSWGGPAVIPPGHFYGLDEQRADFATWNPEVQADYLRRNGLGAPDTWGGTGGPDTADPFAPVVQLHPWEGQSGQALAAGGTNPLLELLSGTGGIQAGRDNPFAGRNWQDQMAQLAPLMQLIQQLLGGR